MTAAHTLDLANPGCPDGPQGFHVYDVMDYIARSMTYGCLYCDHDATEVEILAELVRYEPPPGSVVLQEGLAGVAWQRYHREPYEWKRVNGRQSAWHTVLERSRPNSRVWLVHVPPVPRSNLR